MALAQSTAYTVMMKLFLSSDHVTAATSKTVAITISKAGGAFGNPNAGASNMTEVANGWYKFALDTTDTGTLGELVIRGTATSCDDTERVLQVVSATTGGATNLDAAISSRMATYTQPTGFLAATFPATIASTTNITAGTIASVTGAVGSVTGAVGSVTGLTASNLDATVSSRLASASYTAPPSAASIAAAVWASVIETGYTALQLFRLCASALLGKASGLAGTTAAFRDVNDSKDRIGATIDTSGNRTAVTLDAS